MKANIITTNWLLRVYLRRNKWHVFVYRNGIMDDGRSADVDHGEEKDLQQILSLLLHDVGDTEEVIIVVPTDCAEHFKTLWAKFALSAGAIHCRDPAQTS